MVISEIKQLKNGRFGLFSDGHFLFSLDTETYALCGVNAGDELDGAALDALYKRSQEQKAKEKAYSLLSYRDHSKEELRRKLLRTTDEQSADAAADKMEELGLVNDDDYAEKYARELLFHRFYGGRRAVYEMTRRGLDRELAEQTVASLDDDPAARALQFLTKKYPRGIMGEQDRRRASAALSRNGFDWEDVRQALLNYGMDEENAD